MTSGGVCVLPFTSCSHMSSPLSPALPCRHSQLNLIGAFGAALKKHQQLPAAAPASGPASSTVPPPCAPPALAQQPVSAAAAAATKRAILSALQTLVELAAGCGRLDEPGGSCDVGDCRGGACRGEAGKTKEEEEEAEEENELAQVDTVNAKADAEVDVAVTVDGAEAGRADLTFALAYGACLPTPGPLSALAAGAPWYARPATASPPSAAFSLPLPPPPLLLQPQYGQAGELWGVRPPVPDRACASAAGGRDAAGSSGFASARPVRRASTSRPLPPAPLMVLADAIEA